MLFLQALAKSDKHVWMVTNAHPDALKLKLRVTNIAPYFDHIMSSHQFGKPKEHIEFWQALQHHLHFNPKRSLFIDDSEAVLATADKFGIGHILSIQQPDSQLAARAGLSFPANIILRIFCQLIKGVQQRPCVQRDYFSQSALILR